MRRVALLGVLAFGLGVAYPQTDEEKIQALLEALDTQTKALELIRGARSLHCVFASGYQTSWASGTAVSEQTKFSTSDEPMIFYAIDTSKQTAKVMGNAGSDEVLAFATTSGITFLETTPNGNVNVTTVFATYKKTTEEFPCVHSRHLLMPTAPFPSQFHGTCTVR